MSYCNCVVRKAILEFESLHPHSTLIFTGRELHSYPTPTATPEYHSPTGTELIKPLENNNLEVIQDLIAIAYANVTKPKIEQLSINDYS